MPCCKAEQYKWCKDQPIVFKDGEGKEYCVFHAPKGKKGISVEEFNELVFERIKEVKDKGGFCDLSGTIFEGDISFIKQFISKDDPLPEISFSNATFSGKADFISITFGGVADFSGVVFNEEADFSEDIFGGVAAFTGAKFNGSTNFIRTIFNGKANFLSAMFSKKASFRVATFQGSVEFFNVRFVKEADFSGATFSGATGFSLAQFRGMTDFIESQFDKEADFSKARFGISTNFSFAKFCEEAKFFEAIFGGDTDFIGAIFKRPSYFFKTIFEGKSDFSGSSFGWANFQYATFKGEINFFRNTSINAGDFRGVFINKKVAFDGVNLKEISFIDTDLRKMDFTSCTWPKIDTRDVLYYEIELFKEKKDKYFKEKIKKVEILYRQLKQKYKEEHNEYEVSNWHFGEKEMQRKRSSWKNFSFYLLNLYWVSSGYGEYPVRAGVVLLFLLFYASLALSMAGLIIPDNVKDYYGIKSISWPYDVDFKKAWALFMNTLKYVTFQKDYFFKPINWFGETVKILAQILIPLQTALFALAVRNRFRR